VSRRITVADLIETPVVTPGGHRLGRVVDLEVGRDNRVTAIVIGRRGWLARLHVGRRLGKNAAEVVSWDRVQRIDERAVHLRDGDP
jgi:sporulation protein YlmC with PRC-barrel domain